MRQRLQNLTQLLESRPRVKWWLEWGLLFLGLVGAIWAATQNNAAPQSILIVLLTVLTINFGLPAWRGGVNLLPVVVIAGILILGYSPALALVGVGILLAHLARPLWSPLWQPISWQNDRWLEHIALSFTHLGAGAIAGQVYRLSGGVFPLPPDEIYFPLLSFLWMGLAYVAILFIGIGAVWLLARRPLSQFGKDVALNVLLVSAFSQPFGMFAGIIFAESGLPALILYTIGISAFSAAAGLSWQRSFVLQQQLSQLATLNQANYAVRESLDLLSVLRHTHQQVTSLLPADHFFIALCHENGEWEQPFSVRDGQILDLVDESYQPDDFTKWVVDRARILDLNPDNINYARQHNLKPPHPNPAFWLGIPLATAQRTIGAMSLQRFDPDRPFSQWSREVLLSIAGQVSIAIENARLHSETVRLYNLTDEALNRRLEQLQALLNSTRDGVLMVDTEGQVVLVNPMAGRQLRSEPELLHRQGLDVDEVAHWLGYSSADLQEILRQMNAGIAPQPSREIYKSSYPQPSSAGTPVSRYIERNSVPVLAEDQQIMGWLMTLRDVTEEQESAELRQDVTRMIVHDLRNPVSTLMSTLNRIEQTIPTPTTNGSTHLVDNAKRGCLTMLDMIDSLMDIHRMEAGKLVVEAEAMRLPPLVEVAVDHLQPLADERQIKLTSHIPDDLPAIWGDEMLLRRVLVNLLDNAFKFTPQGGQVQVALQAETAEIGENAGGIRVSIADTGPGIPPDKRSFIFDRYTRISQGGAQVRGTGLGLTFCKLVIEAHGGDIWVESTPTGGSQFFFTVPGIPEFEPF